jgi:acid phosphatase (class A)
MKNNYTLEIKIRHAWIYIAIFPLLISTCAGPKTSLSTRIEEIRPGVVAGYLEFKELPNSIVLLPPPPEAGSAAFELDEEITQQILELSDSARWAQARQDAILYFPEALDAFTGIPDVSISEEQTPNLVILLRRTLSDAVLSTYAAKNHYQRKRPFMVNRKPTCTPEEEEQLMKDGSYPSGHAAIGWAWALVLSEIFPEKTNHIIQRGREFGESRVVCNIHWQSDVNEGRFMGAATLARLHADPVFLADLKAAKKEVMNMKTNPSETR